MQIIKFLDENEIYFKKIECCDIVQDIYEISISGIVRFIDTKNVVNVFYHNFGYPTVNLKTISSDGTTIKNARFLIHRLVGFTFICNIDNNRNIINHIDSNPANNNINNLEWCTQVENMRHAMTYGNFDPIGENNPTARLTNEQAHSICNYMQYDYKYSDILSLVGLEICDKNLDILTKIRTNNLWTHISCLYNIPIKEQRSPINKYSTDQINTICSMLECGKSNIDISKYLNIDMSNRKDSDRFWHFILRIKKRIAYTDISKDYNW